MPKFPPVLWQKLVKHFDGRCLLWIDQSDVLSDPLDDLASLKLSSFEELDQQLGIVVMKGRPSASEGVCMAIVYDWIRNALQIGKDFVATFRGSDHVYYGVLQLSHRLTIFKQKSEFDYRRLRRKLLRIAKRLQSIAPSVSTQKTIDDLEREIAEADNRISRIQKEIYKPGFGSDELVHVWGISEKIPFGEAADISKTLLLPDLQGWILLALEGGVLKPEGGHAIGLFLTEKYCRLLDANTGLFEFSSRKGMCEFFEKVLWEHIYQWLYPVGRYRVVKYSLYPSLEGLVEENE